MAAIKGRVHHLIDDVVAAGDQRDRQESQRDAQGQLGPIAGGRYGESDHDPRQDEDVLHGMVWPRNGDVCAQFHRAASVWNGTTPAERTPALRAAAPSTSARSP